MNQALFFSLPLQSLEIACPTTKRGVRLHTVVDGGAIAVAERCVFSYLAPRKEGKDSARRDMSLRVEDNCCLNCRYRTEAVREFLQNSSCVELFFIEVLPSFYSASNRTPQRLPYLKSFLFLQPLQCCHGISRDFLVGLRRGGSRCPQCRLNGLFLYPSVNATQ